MVSSVPKQVKSVVIGFKTTEQVSNKLKELAELNNTTVSDLCRRIIESYLEQRPTLIKWTIFNGKLLKALKELGRIEITIERGEK